MSLSAKRKFTKSDDFITTNIAHSPIDGRTEGGDGADLKISFGSPNHSVEGWLIGTNEAAKLLGLSPHTLAKWRITGKGPPFHSLGRRCLYSPDILVRWSKAKIRKSTSDVGMEAEL